MRLIILFFLVLPGINVFAQKISSRPLPDSASFQSKVNGDIKQLLRWTDHMGDNYLILTETNKTKSLLTTVKSKTDCPDGCSDKELYAYHFIGKDSLLWKLNDFIRNCGFDNSIEFRKGATKITDLDKNGVAEIWIMYSMACTSDVSPRSLKLILYQGNKKYAIRGTSQPSRQMKDEKHGGIYVPDNEFQKLPQTFKDFARNLWEQQLYDKP